VNEPYHLPRLGLTHGTHTRRPEGVRYLAQYPSLTQGFLRVFQQCSTPTRTPPPSLLPPNVKSPLERSSSAAPHTLERTNTTTTETQGHRRRTPAKLRPAHKSIGEATPMLLCRWSLVCSGDPLDHQSIRKNCSSQKGDTRTLRSTGHGRSLTLRSSDRLIPI
jgi:hypothetical protein